MKLSEIGEFGFIDRFSPFFNDLLTEEITGIGDDCAIIPFGNDDLVITTDLLIEDIHFLRNAITPQQLGYKSLAINLSDIAAMGAQPIGSFLSIGIPADTEVEYLDDFFKGYHELSRKYKTPLLGGDTTKSPRYITINACVIGKCKRGEARMRNAAKDGDVICVTGFLGDSAGGLQVILNKLDRDEGNEYLVLKHLLPEPCIKEGEFLASFREVHAMMDISDGIASDLVHILKASHKKGLINLDSIPVSNTLSKVAAEQKWNKMELAVGGGEDYELLCTVDPGGLEKIKSEFLIRFGRSLYPIGFVCEGKSEISWIKNGKEVKFEKSGFDHFQ